MPIYTDAGLFVEYRLEGERKSENEYYLDEGIVNVVNIFQPEVICLGGGVSNAGEKIL